MSASTCLVRWRSSPPRDRVEERHPRLRAHRGRRRPRGGDRLGRHAVVHPDRALTGHEVDLVAGGVEVLLGEREADLRRDHRGRLGDDALPELDREVELEEEAVGVDHHRQVRDRLGQVGEEARPRSPSSASATAAGPRTPPRRRDPCATRIWRTTSRVPSAVVPHQHRDTSVDGVDDRRRRARPSRPTGGRRTHPSCRRARSRPRRRRSSASARRVASSRSSGVLLGEVLTLGLRARCGGSASRPVTSAAVSMACPFFERVVGRRRAT